MGGTETRRTSKDCRDRRHSSVIAEIGTAKSHTEARRRQKITPAATIGNAGPNKYTSPHQTCTSQWLHPKARNIEAKIIDEDDVCVPMPVDGDSLHRSGKESAGH